MEVFPGSRKLLSLQLLRKSLPINLRTTISLTTSVGIPLELHLQTDSSALKVKLDYISINIHLRG